MIVSFAGLAAYLLWTYWNKFNRRWSLLGEESNLRISGGHSFDYYWIVAPEECRVKKGGKAFDAYRKTCVGLTLTISYQVSGHNTPGPALAITRGIVFLI